MKAAITVTREQDLQLFSEYLDRHQIPHRITEVGEQLVVWVPGDEAGIAVRAAYERWQQGDLVLRSPPAGTGPAARSWRTARRQVLGAPVTSVCLLLAFVLFPLGGGPTDHGPWLERLLLIDLTVHATLGESMATGEAWRLLTPMFIHFGWLHLGFNVLCVWAIGMRLEYVFGSLLVLGLIIGSAVVANVAQYVGYGPSVFGGLSGVVYGLIGFSFTLNRLLGSDPIGLGRGFYVLMLVSFVLGFSGVFNIFGVGIANGAHLGGLLTGVTAGGVTWMWLKSRLAPGSASKSSEE